MGISSTGIGSGLDVNTIVTQLMAAESGPLALLQTKQTANNAKLSAFGTLKSAVATFQTALKGLGATTLGARAATTSDATVLGVSAGADAIAGTYAIEVTQLAKQNKMSSAGHLDTTTPFTASGTMSIQVGDKAIVPIPEGVYSMKSLSEAINKAQAGVTATIVNDGSVNGNRLVITSNDTGVANSVKIVADGGLDEFKFDPDFPGDPLKTSQSVTQNQPGQDAIIKIDNLTITKPSNTITDAVSGLTLNLLKTSIGAPVNVAVAVDKTAATTAVTAFVDAYNKLNTTIKNMTSYNAATKTGAALNGDSSAASIVTALRKEMTTAVASTGVGSLTSLSQIGVAFQRDGTLAVDDVKLQKALKSDFAGVTALFSGTDGYATRLTAVTTDILGTNGVISNRTLGLNDAIKQNAAHQDDANMRLNLTEKRYRAQFSALDTMMSTMQSTSSFLTQQLAALANNN
jgi:flagellar hook-associated protein 2